MALPNIIRFLKKVAEDKELQKKMGNLPEDRDSAISAGLKIAETAGFTITKQDYFDFVKAQKENMLSDEELEAVAGGGNFFLPWNPDKKHM